MTDERSFKPGDLVVDDDGMHGVVVVIDYQGFGDMLVFMANGLVESRGSDSVSGIQIPGSPAPQSFVELVNQWWRTASRNKEEALDGLG